MRLVRYGNKGEESPGVLLKDGRIIDVSEHFPDFNKKFFDRGGIKKVEALVGEDGHGLPAVEGEHRLGSPIARPGKVVCIGKNYMDHIKETGSDMPMEPVLFMKAVSSCSGPNDEVEIPKRSAKTDYEAELGVVIGKTVRYIESEKEAEQYIAGYLISNDYSEREFQKEHEGQWCKGKSFDTFNPLGPWLVTKDEIADVRALSIKLTVNGEERQNSVTGRMIYDPYYLVWYVSQFMTLEAGDVISTGTPHGVAFGMKPQQFLKPGDIVETEISQLGKQRQVCIKAE